MVRRHFCEIGANNASGTNPTWVKVSDSCTVGAHVDLSDPAVLTISRQIKASDGHDAAVLVSPISLGQSTVKARSDTNRSTSVTFAVRFIPKPPPSTTS